ncbi:AbiH family protein [Faecalitalea cylindroides]|uniref:AbiH family protein n=1 Tax=Faecalitalea cylindroides TaxID=39483 RepID=UPI00232F853A|nr:AbiH family protein [Faecalitalea cylindroides]MDB7951539.1 AbiH family protein [Faecalitalea cylindroides]MDB7958384.1 AbiH family protein [Faecalitalea cylindroides]MDB7960436.1 AbiH family protein [Faecalitalea cylindroides]MDB7962306.1 AbiH family protein [Faecalitalea cylindroides]MDB7964177.1 AbiH family protein [Faecalitalea cylindroides]
MKKLFLIGNGFDLAHGLNTRYLDFMNWMYEHDHQTFLTFNKFLLKNFLMKNGYMWEDDWRYTRPLNSVDEAISKMNVSKIERTVEYSRLYEVSGETLILYTIWESLENYLWYLFLDEEVLDIDTERILFLELLKQEDYGEVIESDLDALYKPAVEKYRYLLSLSEKFEIDLLSWVEHINSTIFDPIDYESPSGKDTMKLLPDDFFGGDDYIINFNYSDTIEIIYSKQPLHIHGQSDLRNPPRMGHTKNIESLHYYDERQIKLIQKFYKGLEKAIQSCESYLIDCENIQEIVILGLGYSETDFPYFEYIKDKIPNVNWILYYYSEEDYVNSKKYVANLKLDIDKVEYISIKEKSPYTKVVRYDSSLI